MGVSWFEAAAYCAWAGYRLPTEAEWERAARGTTGRKFPWGDEPADPKRLNYGEDDVNSTIPVGIYPLGATPEGICDMAGNVDDWCADWDGDYPAKPVRNPCGPREATYRVIRGGSWRYGSGGCRSASRGASEPADRDVYLGFRVAAVPLDPVRAGSTRARAEPGA